LKHKTLPWLFEESVEKYSKNIIMWEKPVDKYIGTTYSDMRKIAYDIAGGLLKLGIKKGDRIALISEGRKYWVASELGILYTGAINVPISTKIEELTDLKFRLSHSGCRIVFASQTQALKIRKVKNDLPDLEKIIVLDKMDSFERDEIFIDELIEEGKKYLLDNKGKLEETWQSIMESDYANICYTSGTTADPKGIVLHIEYYRNVEQSSILLKIPEWYCSLLILPWDHAFAHTAGIYTLISNGASMASCPNR
jgi:long-chain acyl-CoA synthetase